MIASMTPEQRAAALEKARIARAEKTAAWKASAHLLKSDFSDSAYWHKLASKYGVRMPGVHVPGTEFKAIRKAARKLGIDPSEIRDTFGGDVKHIHAMNPTWPAFAIIGMLLEMADGKALEVGGNGES
ncbi:MAG: hypothetical protein ACRCXB_20705 [Aeromonadaceae bacterium]